jgi:hypothetical protein
MARRWYVPLTAFGLVFGPMLVAAGAASAAPAVTHHSSAHITVFHAFRPGGVMIRPDGISGSGARPEGIGGGNKNVTVESSNWAGYVVTGSDGAFFSVSASWTQPTATCSSRTDEYAAFWVGLDGYSSDSVEQTGTDSDCDDRTPDYYGWYEMYPADPVYYTSTVEPGDAMSASVTFSGTETYTLVVKDSTQGWTETTTHNESGLDRSSAEVIVEAPCCTDSGGVLPLADFSTICFTNVRVNGTLIGSQNPIEIVLVDSSGEDEASVSSVNASGGFCVTWQRSS